MRPSPLSLYRTVVQKDWLDVNNHMNVAYYGLVFDRSAEVFMAYLGVDNDYIRERDASWVALESHTTYSRELRLGAPLRVTAQVLDKDRKRIHLFQTLLHETEGFQAASNELMIMHVDLGRLRSCQFSLEVEQRLERIAVEHTGLPRPPEQGSVIGIR